MTVVLAEELLNEGMISSDIEERIRQWQSYVNNPVRYESTPGNHFSMLEAPYVDGLAKVLKTIILPWLSGWLSRQ